MTIDERFTDRLNAVLDLGFKLEEVEAMDVKVGGGFWSCNVPYAAMCRVFAGRKANVDCTQRAIWFAGGVFFAYVKESTPSKTEVLGPVEVTQ
jgi:hypothetical protein